MADESDYKPGSMIDGGSADYANPMHTIRAGEELNLIKKDPTLKRVIAGVGWDLRGFDTDPPDLDVSVLLLDKSDQTRVDEDFIFYNNRMGGDGSVRHLGDSRTGAGDGDDEQIELNLATMPFEIMKVSFVLSIYNFDKGMENHTFSLVKNLYFRLINQDTGHEIFRFLLEDAVASSSGTGLMIGELERVGNEWFFHARAQDLKNGLAGFAAQCGILIQQNVQA